MAGDAILAEELTEKVITGGKSGQVVPMKEVCLCMAGWARYCT
jgi:hypothetical protein